MRYEQFSPVPTLTPVAKGLIFVTIGCFLVDFVLTHLGFHVGPYSISELFGLVPQLVVQNGWVWQFVTYLFLHGHPLHLLLNMLVLWYFGAEIEKRLGRNEFLAYFFLCGIGAGLFNFGINYFFNDLTRMSHAIIGSSGAIFGILAAYGLFYGERYFLVFFLFPMKAKYFVLVIAAVELIMGVEANPSDNVAHFAHLGGMLVGAAYIWLRFFRPRGGGNNKKRNDAVRRQFTLIVNPENKGGGVSGGDDDSKDRGPYWN